MGQRHMTYILAEQDAGTRSHSVAVGAFYNQWNHEEIQPPKVLRFIAYLEKMNRKKYDVYIEPEQMVQTFRAAASLSPDGFIRYHDELPYYSKTYGMYGEDNNNGWTLIYVWKEGKKYRYMVACKPGGESYDEVDYKQVRRLGYTSFLNHIKRSLAGKYVEYIRKYGKRDTALLSKIEETFNADKIKEIEGRIKKHIDDLRKGRKEPDE